MLLQDRSGELTASWLPEAGMLGASLVHQGEELLWQGGGPDRYARERAFMGIPFLHPWANRLARFGYRNVELDPRSPLLLLDDNGLPIHGLLTASPDWSVIESTPDTLVAGLAFHSAEQLAAFPFPHRVEMAVAVADGSLEVRVTLSPTGDVPVPVAFGFHPYLQLPGAPRAEWQVAFPVRRRLVLDGHLIPTGATEDVAHIGGAIGERTWDDGFDRVDAPARFEVAAAGRTIAVEFGDGFPVAQVYAPPGRDYLCIEPMTAPANALAGPDGAHGWVNPGAEHSAAFWITPSR